MKIKTYKPKTLVAGEKVNPRLTGKTLVAIPEKRLPGPSSILKICFRSLDGFMYLRRENMRDMLASIHFRDKFNRGQYCLCYFEVKLDGQQLTWGW